MDALPDKPSYKHKQFVNRTKELDVVLEKARRIAAGLPVERRVVIFHGQRGAGKTWLLRELERLLRDYGTPYIIDLSKCDDVAAVQKPEQRPLAVLVENIEEASESQLDKLLEQLLSPLAVCRRELSKRTKP